MDTFDLNGLSLNPDGIDSIINHLREDPAFRNADRQLAAMAIACLVSGSHKDGKHEAGGSERHHPAFWAFRKMKKPAANSGQRIDKASAAFSDLVFDMVCTLRISRTAALTNLV